MKKFDNYKDAEMHLIRSIIKEPMFITKTTYEILGTGFILTKPWNNINLHSNYEYAAEFYNWMNTGMKALSDELLALNPWIKRFVDTSGLPENFSASYGWKIKEQRKDILEELRINRETRRAYTNILFNEDKVILRAKTTHEYPCTVGFQLFIREDKLFMIVNMRSNNVYSVMPYDVYNFTSLQIDLAKELKVDCGHYIHQINNAHIYKGDVRRLQELLFIK